MAYNKSKHVEAAQKLLNQGKVAQAIGEYQNILKHEPHDQVTLMTVGELYIRQGETFQATEYFERLAQIFVGDGFLTKAIAVYKRIVKLAPEEIRPLEKLADLYVQQGVMSEARPLYLQLAEMHLKSNRQSETVALLKKLLAAEPDNLRIQIRLADLYGAMGQKKEAVEAYVDAAQRGLARGDQAESEKLADKALKIEPSNAAAIIIKARVYAAQGKLAEAAQQLEQVPELEKGGEPAELLLDLYVKNLKWDEAAALATRTFEADEKNFGPAQKVAEALLQAEEVESALGLLSRIRVPMIDAGEYEAVARLLNELAAQLPGKLEPYEWLVDTYGRASDSFRMPDALARLGDALVGAGNLDRAREVFEQLVDRDPESEAAKRKLDDVLRKLGLKTESEPEPEVAPAEPEAPQIPKAPEPLVRLAGDAPETVAAQRVVEGDAPLDEETQRFISQSLTDVDLFASYGLTQKAVGLLDAVLRRAPRYAPALEKLLDFLLGTNDYVRTSEAAAQLEQIHRERGDERSAERFAELRRRFQRAANLTPEEPAAAEAPAHAAPASEAAPAANTEAVEEAAVPAPEAPAEAPPEPTDEVHEVDLSEEWAAIADDATPAEARSDAAEAGPQISEPPAPAREAALSGARAADEFDVPVETPPVEEQAPSSADLSAEISELIEPVAPELSEAPPAKPAPPPALPKPPVFPPVPPSKETPKSREEPVLELELDQDYELVLEPETLVPPHEQVPPMPAGPAQLSADEFLADLAKELDELDITEKPVAPAAAAPPASASKAPAAKAEEPAPAPAAGAPSSFESGPLHEVFEEFRAELGEMGAEDEDLETHYNLGIAFREMGLLDEAISEFQKVAQAGDRGRAFRYAMQCCTLLGLAFMEKGQSAIAAHWYERALQTPDLDPESALALRYDLGVAQESAGEIEAALKSFTKVYAANIDYRDVADRIAALEKTAR